MTGRAAWSALTTGLGLVGGAVSLLVYARFGWHPRDPFALGGAFLFGVVAGVVVAALVADGLTRFDRAVGRSDSDVLRVARAVGVTKDGAR